MAFNPIAAGVDFVGDWILLAQVAYARCNETTVSERGLERVVTGARIGLLLGVVSAGLGAVSYSWQGQGLMHRHGLTLGQELGLDLIAGPFCGGLVGLLSPFARSPGLAAVVGAVSCLPILVPAALLIVGPAASIWFYAYAVLVALGGGAIAGVAYWYGRRLGDGTSE